jgi:hypothetical protein
MAGIYMNAAYPSLDELVRTGGADPLVPLFNESALDLLSREERWELDDPIEHDIVEVADLVFAPGMVDPNKF